ncbi:hypothetical protein ANCCAN_12998 [Ancylostoma caninum]|uniref:Surfactant protein B n=1 Tax=Ancylostoma caninum TaxID=29170 RepID=A0A368G9H1_ANCCA|nr:hypothetical protein ANCCAN_12998 [Ancylostoma caninum]
MLFSLIISFFLATAAMASCSTPATWGNCQCPEDMAQGIYQLVTRFTGPAIIEKILLIVVDDICAGKTPAQIKTDLIMSAPTELPPSQTASLLGMRNDLGECLKPLGSSEQQLIDKVGGPLIEFLNGPYNQLKGVAESEKKSGKTCTDARAAILKAGCKMVKPEMIANIFKLCKAKISPDEWRCAKTSTPNLILWDKYD